jgi:hypothetical protein
MTKRILAVASSGGHWEQLMVLSGGLAGFAVTYATTAPRPEAHVILRDCSRDSPMGCLICAWQAFWLIVRARPDFVVSTGAAPGLIALFFGKLLGAKTVWIDSVANAEQLSMSGRLAGGFADLQLTQWQHVADTSGARYMGGLL